MQNNLWESWTHISLIKVFIEVGEMPEIVFQQSIIVIKKV